MPLRFLKTWKLDDIEKRPLVVMIALLISMLFFSVSRKDTREEDCNEEKKEWQDRYVNLTNALMEKNDIIESKDKEIDSLKSEKTDSVVREEVSQPIKNILK
ncbi:hypothetical protein [Albibacterium profundi]|uniref:Uncharacterized protein n=1 Tax=Albibacterium profundi TaxID=3134906 RepID=A0ABV5CEZ2_9SPHI